MIKNDEHYDGFRAPCQIRSEAKEEVSEDAIQEKETKEYQDKYEWVILISLLELHKARIMILASSRAHTRRSQ